MNKIAIALCLVFLMNASALRVKSLKGILNTHKATPVHHEVPNFLQKEYEMPEFLQEEMKETENVLLLQKEDGEIGLLQKEDGELGLLQKEDGELGLLQYDEEGELGLLQYEDEGEFGFIQYGDDEEGELGLLQYEDEGEFNFIQQRSTAEYGEMAFAQEKMTESGEWSLVEVGEYDGLVQKDDEEPEGVAELREYVQEIISQTDANGSGGIDFDEFYDAAEAEAEAFGEEMPSEEELRGVFDFLDHDGDGEVTANEVVNAIVEEFAEGAAFLQKLRR